MKRTLLLLCAVLLPGLAHAQDLAKAAFAAGCFWCTEQAFEKVPGVVSVVSGYMGGHTKHPTYREVSAGGTGHSEVVQVTYDPKKVSYQTLLDTFWVNHDPTALDHQFCDHGSQYRPAIFTYTPEQERFREEVRTWIAEAMPAEMKKHAEDGTNFEHAEIMEWHKILYAKGWVAPNWPKEVGGTGWDVAQRSIFQDEMVRANAPSLSPFGLSMVGPLLIQYGSDEQKKRFLPKILSGEEVWCQGYSEPNAGSDLANLQLRADKDGDDYILNGQKTWTTYAQYADWIFCLVRTDASGKKQEGISFLLIDMKTPGVSIRPIKQIDGQQGFYETFFDNVNVPVQQMVGSINEGWSMAKALLAHERSSTGEHVDVGRLVRNIKTLARGYERDGRPVLEDESFRQRLARLEMDADGLRYTRYRLLTALMQGRTPGPEASIVKVYQSELCQALYDLALEAMGPDAARWYDESLSEEAFEMPMQMTITRAMSIYSGSNEIQRNIIAKRVLNLPD